MAAAGNYAYVLNMDIGRFVPGLQVIDIRDPAHPQRVGSYYTSGNYGGVAASGNYVYVADMDDGLNVLDVRNPAQPQRVGGYNTSAGTCSVAVAGNYAYLADYTAGLQVLDIRDRSQPQRVGGYDTSGFAQGVAVAGNYEANTLEQLKMGGTVLQSGPAPASGAGTVLLTNWAGWRQRFFRLQYQP